LPCFEAHHEIVTGNLVLCEGSRFGVKLNGYLPKKPETCADCDQWIDRCLRGETNRFASSQACEKPGQLR